MNFAIPTANIIQDLVSPISNLLDGALRTFFDWGIPWGWGIILLTVIVRLLLLPLTYKQVTSMLHMQQYQPQIKELNEKYKDDPKRKQEELMKFFKTHGINPLASCFPLLLQMPFFIAMFYALREPSLQVDMNATDSSFFFISSLTKGPSGAELVILLVLYVGSQLGSTLVSLSSATDQMQRRLMLALPFIFVPFVINFPAGLILYWITTNFWTLGQSFVVKWMRIRQGDPVLVGSADDGDAAVVTSGGAAVVEKKPTKAPPPPPKTKKKRSGRRR
ncbi:MAG: membrane protein insertase YidC [Solirubrobacterales bacterium]|nr:membrane protein insertase YidC [Solirubrobacterales bacterium]